MIKHPFTLAATCALFALLHFPASVFAGNVTVTTSADAGLGSLRQTVATASPGDTVRFFVSLFGNTITLTSGAITIDKNLRIVGLGDDSTFISGNNNSRIFNVNVGVTARFERMTLQQGASADSGGAIFNRGALTLQYCVLDGNTAKYGGAIYNNGSLTLADCIFTDNIANAGQGGAVFSFAGGFSAEGTSFSSNNATAGGGAIASIGSCVLNGVTVSGNSSNKGGGIYAENSLILNYCTIASNNATAGHGGGIHGTGNTRLISCMVEGNVANNGNFSGGGVYSETSFRLIGSTVRNNTSAGNSGGIHSIDELTIISSTLYGNIATKAGGAISNYGTALLNTSTVSGNSAGFSGGGIKNAGKTTLLRSTIAFNTSDSSGGGIASFDSLLFSNTIVGNNAADAQGDEIFKASGSVISEGYNLVRDNAQSGFTPNIGDILGTTATPKDPLLDPLADNGGSTFTHIPRCGSPAIDKGDTTDAPASDQRDLPRIHGAGIDIGSVENQADPVAPDAIITHVSAIGASDGAIQALIDGGTPPYFLDWSTGDSVYTITGLTAGNYGLTVEDFYGCTATAVFEVDEPNGIVSIENEMKISVFPNPANTSVIIQTGISEIYRISIYDFSGKMVKIVSPESWMNNEAVEISVQDLPEGNYMLQLSDEKGMAKGRGRFAIVR